MRKRIRITRHGKELAAVVPIEDLELYEQRLGRRAPCLTRLLSPEHGPKGGP